VTPDPKKNRHGCWSWPTNKIANRKVSLAPSFSLYSAFFFLFSLSYVSIICSYNSFLFLDNEFGLSSSETPSPCHVYEIV
jgi:hypothetical protein